TIYLRSITNLEVLRRILQKIDRDLTVVRVFTRYSLLNIAKVRIKTKRTKNTTHEKVIPVGWADGLLNC
ncbi:hypothetical protein DLH97_26350, partial [Vibrio parahaemolyticus]|nr:hypothetical protein [Vibrio parahaemolyticus]EGR2875620.1 hypothetical protein [Vibrio parahaemolyticus]